MFAVYAAIDPPPKADKNTKEKVFNRNFSKSQEPSA